MRLRVDVRFPTDFKEKAKQFPRISSAALNRVTQDARTYTRKIIQETYNLPAGEINQRLTVSRAKPNHLVSRIIARGKKFPLIMFAKSKKITTRQEQVIVEVTKGSPKVVKGGFIQKGKNSGNLNIFRRIGDNRYPITVKQFISVPEIIDAAKIRGRVISFIDIRLPREIDRLIKVFREKGER